jgi:hypothetical protein
MTIRIPLLIASALLFTTATACTGYGPTGGGTGGGGHQGSYIYTAKTNSAAWAAGDFTATTSDNGNQVDIVGSQVTDTLKISILLHLSGFRGQGTYPLADQAGGPHALVEYSRLPLTTGDNGLYVTSATATGEAIVTSYNAHTGYVAGTFHFRTTPSGTPGPNVPDTVDVTQGQFTGAITQ